MTTTTTTTRTTARRRRTAAIVTLALAGSVVAVGTAAAHHDPPPWSVCAFRDHPVAADIVPQMASTSPVSDELRAVLNGETAVGTDCSIYDLPV